MANELNVSTDGLRTAAANSEITAAELAAEPAEGGQGTHPSQAGVAAILAAAQSVRARQSLRVSGQADDLSVSSARYDDTDSGGAEAITGTV
ncbi:hypothetical protein [Mycobacterium hubeiense]|uniref:hypothetical protein n=1 Tax=Mycobacterium hubeiense TaxID=1867256 RepID=UPI000C7EC7FD|nr:hypothetical protein [Mycobacterium sp. QGD 101]